MTKMFGEKSPRYSFLPQSDTHLIRGWCTAVVIKLNIHETSVNFYISSFFIFSVAPRHNAGHGLLVLEVFSLDHIRRRFTVGKTPLDE